MSLRDAKHAATGVFIACRCDLQTSTSTWQAHSFGTSGTHSNQGQNNRSHSALVDPLQPCFQSVKFVPCLFTTRCSTAYKNPHVRCFFYGKARNPYIV